MNQEGVTICQKHNKKENNLNFIANHYYICLNRYCPDAYKVLCSSCKPQHRDHTTKMMSIQDLGFLLDRLLQKPVKQVGIFMSECVELMKKLQLIRQFKKKIDILSQQIQLQTFAMLDSTQSIFSQFVICKKKASEISEKLFNLQDSLVLNQFMNSTAKNLSIVDYNFKTDQLQYSNLQIRDKFDSRKKSARVLRSKIEELKQYNMKIIQVILNDDQSQEEQEDLLCKKKMYEDLKHQLRRDIEEQKTEKSKIYASSQTHHNNHSNRINQSVISENTTFKSKQTQTNEDFMKQKYQLKIKELKSQLEASGLAYRSLQSDIKTKTNKIIKDIEVMTNEKNNLQKQKDKLCKNYQKKMNLLDHYQKRLRDNRRKRVHRERQRQDVFAKFIQLIEHQKRQSRSKQSRSSLKDSRFKKNPIPF